ncbi:MAG TPA: hypothetical protein VI322_03815, partial [Candidatus Saccharimonadia bacterium]
MSKIFLYGASGTGKTIIRHQLSQHLDFPLIRAEDIKDAATEAAEASGGRDDIVLLSAKEAWRRFGNLTEANIIKSLQAIRESTRKVLDPQLATYENVI